MKHGDTLEMAAVADALLSSLFESIEALDLCPHCTIMTVLLNITQHGVAREHIDLDNLDDLKEIIERLAADRTEQRVVH